MTIISTYKEAVPTWALSYLINGDASGVEESGIARADAWWADFLRIAGNFPGSHAHLAMPTAEESGDPYFTWNPAFGLACDVLDCQVLLLAPDLETAKEVAS